MSYTVQVIEYATESVVKEIPCNTEREALRVDRGLNMNLNHERFYTLVDESTKEKNT